MGNKQSIPDTLNQNNSTNQKNSSNQENSLPKKITRNIQIQTKLIQDSVPVAGSPLVNYKKDYDEYIQPSGERIYKNTSKIQSISDDKVHPCFINNSFKGKTVYLTGSFNQWKEKILVDKDHMVFIIHLLYHHSLLII